MDCCLCEPDERFSTIFPTPSGFFPLPSEFKDLLEIAQKDKNENAKWLVAEQNNITVEKGAINFYGNEHTLIIQPF